MKAKVNNLITFKKTYCWLIACLVISVQVLLSAAYAATHRDNNFNQLIARADVIVFGKCISLTSEWRKKKIYSNAAIQVESVIKGDAPSVIQVEYMGGTAMHPTLNVPVVMNVSSGIDFKEGNESVLILKQLANNRFQVAGAARGKIPVVTDRASGEKIIQSGMKKIQSKPSNNGNSIVLSSKQMSLQEFMEFLQSRLRIEKERGKR